MPELSKYLLIANTLRKDIADEVFTDGQPLMTETELATRFKVSRQTIRQAIALLEEDGLVVRRRGSGTYVSHHPRKHGRLITVGVVTTYITDYIFPSIVRGIESVLSANGCVMSLSATYNQTAQEEALLEQILRYPLDGYIFEGTRTAAPNPNIHLYEALRQRNIPTVFINGCYPELSRAVYVVMDDRAGGRQAAEYLINKGHRRIGGIFKADDRQGVERYMGMCQALEDHVLSAEPALMRWFTTDTKSSFLAGDSAEQLIADLRAYQADALLCYNDDIAIQLMALLQKAGLVIPDDLSLISFDNSVYASICTPGLTSLSHPKEQFGCLAAEKLLQQIRGETAVSEALTWTLAERNTVAKRTTIRAGGEK